VSFAAFGQMVNAPPPPVPITIVSVQGRKLRVYVPIIVQAIEAASPLYDATEGEDDRVIVTKATTLGGGTLPGFLAKTRAAGKGILLPLEVADRLAALIVGTVPGTSIVATDVPIELIVTDDVDRAADAKGFAVVHAPPVWRKYSWFGKHPGATIALGAVGLAVAVGIAFGGRS